MAARLGLAAGTVLNNRPSITADDDLALLIWHQLGGALRFPDAAYWMALHQVADVERMLARLVCIRDTVATFHRTRR